MEQVEYINKGLETQSLVKVCQAIGISEATVRDRFKNKGYTRKGKVFISTTTNTENTTNTNGTNDTNKIAIAEKDVNTNKTKSTKRTKESNNIKVLEARISSLEAKLEGLINTIDTITTSNTTNTIDTKDLIKYEGATVSRNYRINEEIQKEFKLLCNKLTSGTEFTVTDIISQALENYINKHS